MSQYKPDQTLDARGLCCPLPVIRTKKVIETMAPGEILEIITTDPGSKNDIPAWARQTGNELLSMADKNEAFFFYIKKTSE